MFFINALQVPPDVVQQREQIFQLLHIKPGMQALDIGCGPGLTSLALALAVGFTAASELRRSPVGVARAPCKSNRSEA
jgi:cyclopropane fatty-acyl-phospholipid synthase-like methyltransferase